MISVIGAGPVGSCAAYYLAKEGFKVDLYEEHKEIGKPVQCTGIFTIHINEALKGLRLENEGCLVNTIKKTRVFSPNNSFVDIDLKKNYIVDRSMFDKLMADLAQSAGAKLFNNSRFLKGRRKEGKIEMQFNKGTKTTDMIIGADGPFSAVAKSFSLYGNRKFILGTQARIRMKEKIDPNIVEFFLEKGYFGWLVPEDEKVARIGVASNDRARYYFNSLIEKRPGRIIEWQSGPIPVYDPKIKTEDNNVFLVGDAAAQVKATTYGGIVPGIIASRSLATAIKEKKSYAKLWKNEIGKDLWIHLMMRKAFNMFSDKDYNKLISLVNQNKITRILTEHDREFPSKIVAKMLLREPRFLRFFPSVMSAL